MKANAVLREMHSRQARAVQAAKRREDLAVAARRAETSRAALDALAAASERRARGVDRDLVVDTVTGRVLDRAAGRFLSSQEVVRLLVPAARLPQSSRLDG